MQKIGKEPAKLGKDYSLNHRGLKRLAKIFDYEDRLPYHIHQMQHHASLLGRNSKDEAYYFPGGVDAGKHLKHSSEFTRILLSQKNMKSFCRILSNGRMIRYSDIRSDTLSIQTKGFMFPREHCMHPVQH